MWRDARAGQRPFCLRGPRPPRCLQILVDGSGYMGMALSLVACRREVAFDALPHCSSALPDPERRQSPRRHATGPRIVDPQQPADPPLPPEQTALKAWVRYDAAVAAGGPRMAPCLPGIFIRVSACACFTGLRRRLGANGSTSACLRTWPAGCALSSSQTIPRRGWRPCACTCWRCGYAARARSAGTAVPPQRVPRGHPPRRGACAPGRTGGRPNRGGR